MEGRVITAKMIAGFREHLILEERSVATIQKYIRDVKAFMAYAQNSAITKETVIAYAEALNHPFDEPKQWEIREINEIMNNSIEGWKPFSNPRSFAKYGRQRGWERIPPPDNEPSATGSNLTDGFRELTEEEARQMELPF